MLGSKTKGRFLAVDLAWAILRLYQKLLKLLILPFVSVTTKTPDSYRNVEVEKNVAITMRDGIRLYANIYKPDAEGKSPVILIRLPYGKDEYYCQMSAIGKYWAKKGYACVVQDVRGKWRSEGKWDPFVNESSDGYDTIDWIARQPWCDGNIGMTGESYFGYTQWAVASLDHPNLKCIAPATTACDIYGVWVYSHNAFCMQTLGTWAYAMNSKKYLNHLRLNPWHLPLMTADDGAGTACEYYRDWIRHPLRDTYWHRINLCQKYHRIKIPVLHLGGWYDTFLKGTLDDWRGIIENSESYFARKNQWLVVGPIDHEWTTEHTHRIGRMDIGENGVVGYDLLQQFFDYWLKGIDNGFHEIPRVKIFVMGDNEWRYENEWPLARAKYTKYYLHSSGSANTLEGDGWLDEHEPVDELTDSYVYDPNNPITLSLQTPLWEIAKHMKDRVPLERRADVLVYTTSELEQDIEITGPITVILYAASSARDTDFSATLVDVYPEGYAHLVREGLVRARCRDSDRNASLIEPGKVYKYPIDLWATSHVVKKGHRIRVEISSSNFNRYDRNLNTGGEPGTDTETVKATQTIYHDANRPSHITLSVIPR